MQIFAALARTGARPRRLRASRWIPAVLLALALLASPLSAQADEVTPCGPEPLLTIAAHDAPLPVPGFAGPDVPWPVVGAPTSPPPDPQVGDSWIWWLWVHFPMPPHWEQRSCTVRGRSDHAYVVVEDSQWNVTIDQADVDQILERWENSSPGPYPDMGIYEINSMVFGEPPDEMDDDPRIYIVWFDFGIDSDGFFFDSDQYPEGAVPGMHSNECETLYMNSDSPGGGPSSAYMLSVIAHEFEHMIHWKYDADEAQWVDEGLAELAMWFYGRPDVISGFNSSPDNPLTDWQGNWADYIQTYLWSLYFHERYGGQPAVYDVLHEPANGIAGYDAILDLHGYPEDFDDAFADWVVANYLDDPTIGDGRFGYLGADLPPFYISYTFTTYPVANFSRTVNYWAADYYRFLNVADLGSLRVEFNGGDTNRFAVWALVLHAAEPTEVHRMTVDLATQEGTIDVPGLTDAADEVILVVASIASSGSPSYVINAGASPAAAPELVLDGGAALRVTPWPNPMLERASFELRWAGPSAGMAEVELFDAAGRRVRTLSGPAGAPGSATLVWDGTDEAGQPAGAGLFFARARAAGQSARTVLLRLP